MVKEWVLDLKDACRYHNYEIEEIRMCLYSSGDAVNVFLKAQESLELLRKRNSEAANSREPIYRDMCDAALITASDELEKINDLATSKGIAPICRHDIAQDVAKFCDYCVDELFDRPVSNPFQEEEYYRLVDALLRIEEDKIRERGERADEVLERYMTYEDAFTATIDVDGFAKYCELHNIRGWREQYPDLAQEYDTSRGYAQDYGETKKDYSPDPARGDFGYEYRDDDDCR